MRPLAALSVLLLAAPASLHGQFVIDPGMSKAQVIVKLGPPAMQKASGTSTYLYYRNGVEKRVGMSDLVVLDSDKVVDAVFRSSARKYSGKSSSPVAIPAEVARRHPQVTPPPGDRMSVPPTVAASAAPAPKTGAKEAQKMPAEKAQEVQIAKPTPQARSAILEQQKAAAKAADSAKAAKAVKPDPVAPPVKKP